MRWKLGALYTGLLAFSGVAFLWLLLLRSTYAPLVSLGLLAYVFGLRHALDADHIAAIDNTTRKLMHDGQEPLTVGLFFSLGHSTIVLLLSLGLTISAHYLATHLPLFEHIGTILGTAISALFLYLIALLNLFILRDVYGIFQMVRREGRETDPERLE
jgi:high-affinity nickel-transport protein